MYPTVNALMGLWRYVVAEEVSVVHADVADTTGFLRTITPEKLFDPATWTGSPSVRSRETRRRHSADACQVQPGKQRLSGGTQSPVRDQRRPEGRSLVRVARSGRIRLLTGRVPTIVEAFRIVPKGQLASLRPITLRGAVPIDPRRDDFFRKVIEERKRLASNTALSPEERQRLDKALKVLANATSYGIFAEMIREETAEKFPVTCYGIDPKPFACKVRNPEHAGEYCFPPLASLITAAARLMLALLERCVTDLGGTYAMEDTDSMAIVATQRGGLIECPGGPYRKLSKPAIRALSWKQVDAIAQRFERLNPYDRARDPRLDPQDRGRQLRSEDRPAAPAVVSGDFRQAICPSFAIQSANRRCSARASITRKTATPNTVSGICSIPPILRATIAAGSRRHGSRSCADRWASLRSRSDFEKRVAVGRITISSPAVMKPLKSAERRKALREADQTVQLHHQLPRAQARSPDRRRSGALPLRSRRTRPIRDNGRRCNGSISIRGKRYRITASGPHGSRTVARVKSYGDVLREYEFHPEAKCADSNGAPCRKQTVGLLGRRHIAIDSASRTSARSRITWKRSKSRASWIPATFIRSIPIRSATSSGNQDFT